MARCRTRPAAEGAARRPPAGFWRVGGRVGGDQGLWKRLAHVGGGTKGGLWTQIVSDILGRPQEIRRQTIGACYGDAFLAAIAGGLVDAGARWNEVADMTRPNPQVTEMCDPLYDIYRSLYPATRDQLHRLADMQEGAAEPMT